VHFVHQHEEESSSETPATLVVDGAQTETRTCWPREAAELVGISPNGLSARRARPNRSILDRRYLPPLPEPAAELRCGPIWTRAEIEEYFAELERFACMSFDERWERHQASPKTKKLSTKGRE
jgi:hypothetical protein